MATVSAWGAVIFATDAMATAATNVTNQKSSVAIFIGNRRGYRANWPATALSFIGGVGLFIGRYWLRRCPSLSRAFSELAEEVERGLTPGEGMVFAIGGSPPLSLKMLAFSTNNFPCSGIPAPGKLLLQYFRRIARPAFKLTHHHTAPIGFFNDMLLPPSPVAQNYRKPGT